ncbi:hypothetical protein ES703_34729 [subsurface metagenome]
MGKSFEQVRCPVCNRTYPAGFWGKIASVTRDCLGFLMRRAERGQGGFEVIKELTLRREVRPETLLTVKSRLILALRLWLQKGWLPGDEVVALLNSLEQERISGWRLVYTYEGPGFHPVSKTYGRVSVARPLRMPLNKYMEEVTV